ncbi:MAG: assimilatory sulfite reductase (NADPH) flavoprotein subunit [Pseudomonadota bacterium]|nr:assimilatory sulfite reductase (NADPH) flavoprotein subunit [Pseudomonadota bacterium]
MSASIASNQTLLQTAPAEALPLSQEQLAQLAQLAGGLDSAGLWWLSGYAAGMARTQHPALRPMAAPPETSAGQSLTIVYGSQTGNARGLAEKLAKQAEGAGLAVRLLRADDYPTRELGKERLLYIVISTQGDGDPPDDAYGLVEFITGKRAPALKDLKYAVLGLGDSTYPQFCVIGRLLDERLAELGGTRLLARGEADFDVETIAEPWMAQALSAACETLGTRSNVATVTPLRPLAAAAIEFTRDKPFQAELLANQRITGRGSDRDTRHLEISLEGSGLQYEPGDALGVWPTNPPALVEDVLDALHLDGASSITREGESLPLREWLSDRRELTRLSRPFVARHAVEAGNPAIERLLEPENAADFTRLLAENQVIDLLRLYPAVWSGEDLVAALRPLSPRLYSLASSQKLVGEEAHLTLDSIEYDKDGQLRWGTASSFLARAAEGERLPVFIEHNERFRVPQDGSRDIVMIGPGTGVAPFRGFLQERVATGATGRNWLLFGNPHRRSDFLYQVEWQDALRRGELHRLDLAFSRDQVRALPASFATTVIEGASPQQKTYVQHRLREHGAQLFAWLQDGAHLYVCGDATRMARDVHATLIDVIALHGRKSQEEAGEILADLARQGRYARDVY